MEWRIYVGGYNTEKNFGINSFSYNASQNLLVPEGLAIATDNPSYLVAASSGKYVYCVNETVAFEGCGTISAFAADPQTGKLTEIAKQSSYGTYPCHLTLNKRDRYLYVANYGNGSITAYPISKKTGEIGSYTFTFQNEGSGVNENRQKGPHAHCVTFEPKFRHLYSCDLGTDQINIFEAHKKGIPLTRSRMGSAPASQQGSGPRHIAFHPSCDFAYVVNELDNTVALYKTSFDTAFWRNVKKKKYHKDGQIDFVNSWSTLPEGFDGQNLPAAIRIHPNGKFLYVSNRGADTIASFAINKKTGELTHISDTPCGGKSPRDFAIHPSGSALIVANQDSNNLTTFWIDCKTGTLKESGMPAVQIDKPTCVIFVPKDFK